jgi:uroporphyrinogen III methyltransferase / synthase
MMAAATRSGGPLAGRRIVVTRAPEQAAELNAALSALGAEVLAMPTMSFAAVTDFSALDAALDRVGEFDWLVFASQNAVRFVTERLLATRKRASTVACPALSVAAVGQATATASGAAGFRVTYTARNPSGESLASELAHYVASKSVLLPRSDRGDARLMNGLREAGARVTDVVAYRTLGAQEINAEALGEFRAGQVDAVLFASPSAFQNLCEVIPVPEMAMLSLRVNFAAIGPTTAKALREAGVRVAIQPTQSSAILLADAVAKFYTEERASAATGAASGSDSTSEDIVR